MVHRLFRGVSRLRLVVVSLTLLLLCWLTTHRRLPDNDQRANRHSDSLRRQETDQWGFTLDDTLNRAVARDIGPDGETDPSLGSGASFSVDEAQPFELESRGKIEMELRSDGKEVVDGVRPVGVCDIGLAILTAPRYHETRVAHLEASWLRRVCHDPPNFVLVSSELHPRLPTYSPPCPETYEALCCKSLASFGHMLREMPDKKWYMKLDDDTLLSPTNLANEINWRDLDPERPYLLGGQLYSTPQETGKRLNGRSDTLKWAEGWAVRKAVRGGSGYLLSRGLAQTVVNRGDLYLSICSGDDPRYKNVEDASLAQFVTTVIGQSALVHIPGMFFHRPEVAYRMDYSRRDFAPVSFHLMHSTADMPLLDYLLNGGSPPAEHRPTAPLAREGPLVSGGGPILQRVEPLARKGLTQVGDLHIACTNGTTCDVNERVAGPPAVPGAKDVFSTSSPNEPHPCESQLTNLTKTLTDYYTPVFSGIREAVVIGLPDHPNRGDSAILAGALVLLDLLQVSVLHAVHHVDRDYDAEEIRGKWTVGIEERAIVFHGGGNFGDLYKHHHNLRAAALADFPDHKVIMFPQTVHFNNETNLEHSADLYSRHGAHVWLAARDVSSYDILYSRFSGPNVDVVLLPDCAFMLGDLRRFRGLPRVDLLFHARVDSEAPKLMLPSKSKPMRVADVSRAAMKIFIDDAAKERIQNDDLRPKEWFDYVTFVIDDWVKNDVHFENGTEWRHRIWSRTRDGMAFLSRARLVVTNRLHGHILMTLMGMPHVMMGDAYSKLWHYRDTWTASCPLSTWAESLPEAVGFALDRL